MAGDDLTGSVALVTGGGRGIGLSIARELADAGAQLAVSARSREQVERVAEELGAVALVGDISREEDAAGMVRATEETYGRIDLLVANAGIGGPDGSTLDVSPPDWWHVFEVNVLGTYLCCRAVLPGMIERGAGRIVILGSGASYLPVGANTANGSYGASKAAVGRFAEYLASEAAPHGISVFLISPGMVQTDMTASFGPDMPWTPPELAPSLVHVLASGRADRLAGRYIHAEHDDIEALIRRADEVIANDLNAIRIRR
jgi:3-oxoacyl-[acyl-carrier protein] reductase